MFDLFLSRLTVVIKERDDLIVEDHAWVLVYIGET